MSKHTVEIHICDGCDARGSAHEMSLHPCVIDGVGFGLCGDCVARARDESPTIARAMKRAKDGAESCCG